MPLDRDDRRSQAPPLSSDLMRALAEIEDRFPVARWHIAGVPIWPLLRLRWFFAEWARHYAAASGAAPASAGAHVRRIAAGALAQARAAREDVAATDHGARRRDIVFLSDGLSFGLLGGAWVERFCDPLIAIARQRGLTSALWTPSRLHQRPRLTPSCFVQAGIDRANLAGALRAKLAPRPAHLPERERVEAWLGRAGHGHDALRVGCIESDGCRLRSVADHFRRALDVARPSLAFVVSYYGLEGMAFVLACREAGILVVDLQHGVQGDMHPAYARWPRPDAGVHALLPDRFWVWSSWEEDVVAQWSKGTRHAPIVGGNPWLEVWRDGSGWPGVAAASEAASGLRQRADGRPVVLTTLQYGLDPAEQMQPLAAVMRIAASRLVFWVRLHPAMLERREEIRGLLEAAGPFELDLPSDLPLQALLPRADVHLTHSSSTVIEAAQFGIHSVLTTDYGRELFGPLLASGDATVAVGGAQVLVDELDRSIAQRRGRSRDMPQSQVEAAFDRLAGDARKARAEKRS